MFLKTMTEPIIANDEGVNVKPELMEKEKLYHCIYKDKVILVYNCLLYTSPSPRD